jgi:hypothetical protein
MPVSAFSILLVVLSVVSAPAPRQKRLDTFSGSAPHLKRLDGHSPVRACDQKISAVGMPNRARFAESYTPVFFSLSLLNTILNALESIFHHKKIAPPVTARFPTPDQNCFCSGFIFV